MFIQICFTFYIHKINHITYIRADVYVFFKNEFEI